MHHLKNAIRSLRQGAGFARHQFGTYRRLARLCRERDVAYAAYSTKSPQCLHLGAERFAMPDWFNTDLNPIREGTYYLDAAGPYPFPDASFDYIFSEHMIEHISFKQGLEMLAECRRVLRPGGVVRIATPNLRNILSLIAESEHHEAYLQWAAEQFRLPTAPFPKAPGVINNFFQSWGHRFIYDPAMLRTAILQVGFAEIAECEIGESQHEALRKLEKHGEMWNPWINKFETMVFEATTPASKNRATATEALSAIRA